MLQQIFDRKWFDWAGRGRTAADVQVGGDQPFVRRIVGVSTPNQVGSVYNQGVRIAGVWAGKGERSTVERNRKWAEQFVSQGHKTSVQLRRPIRMFRRNHL